MNYAQTRFQRERMPKVNSTQSTISFATLSFDNNIGMNMLPTAQNDTMRPSMLRMHEAIVARQLSDVANTSPTGREGVADEEVGDRIIVSDRRVIVKESKFIRKGISEVYTGMHSTATNYSEAC